MLSNFYKYALVLCLISCFGISYAQSVVSLEALWQKQISIQDTQSEKVKAYAIRNQLPVVQNTTEGRQLLMVDIVEGIPIYLSVLNSDAAVTTGASKIQGGASGIKLDGEGILIGVWDEGSVKEHIELGARVISKEVDSDATHATHVTGTIIATGINPNAKGMAPKAEVTNWYFNNDLAEMTALAKPDESSLLLSNHSYGTVTGWTPINGAWNWSGNPAVSGDEDYRFGFYGTKAAALDQLANLAPYYTIVWAAGNDRGEPGDGSRPPDCNGGTGYDCIIPESVAKNIITVGAVNKVTTYSGPSSVVMSTFSSWGPTDDGRIKPDLVAAGVNLFSLSADGTNVYGFLSGTSMATPNVTGSLALLQELYGKLHGGKVMKAATLKALAIHNVKEAGLLPGPDYSFGWGLLDVEEAAKLLVKEDGINTMVREEQLHNGSQLEWILQPKANQKITATIVWNDPAAEPVTTALDPIQLMLVNDLDIKLIAENGQVHYPWLLDPSTPSGQAIKGDNYRDNIEKLEFNFPEAKPYRLVVSHKGTLKNESQDFSIIITYQSFQSTYNTLYWVGDSGNWGDNSHWSFTSGGAPAFMIPSANDRVIIDENSFDGIGSDEITLTQNRSCGAFKWLRSTSANLNLQGNTLSVNNEFTLANSSFGTTGTGFIKCATQTGSIGNVNFTQSNLGMVGLVIDGGVWSLRGNLTGKELDLKSGKLSIANSALNLDRLVAETPAPKELNMDKVIVNLTDYSNLNGDNVQLNLIESKIKIENTTSMLDWHNIIFNGILEITGANITIKGNNFIEELKVHPGSAITLENASNQNINTITQLAGEAGKKVSIASPGKASLTIADHFLLCTDFLDVTNVDIAGTTKINLGANSTITNSINWYAKSCASVVFADFDEKYLCEKGFTEFVNKSQGSLTSWVWNFGDEASAINTSEFKNPFHEFSGPGNFIVQLTVSDGLTSHSFAKQLMVVSSATPKNEVAVSGSDLTSLTIASSYQWFKNEQKIEGATLRSYPYEGREGVYRVVTYEGTCNLTSDLVTITDLVSENHQLNIYPNPVDNALMIESDASQSSSIVLTDLLGKVVFKDHFNGTTKVYTQELSNGIYLLRITSSKGELVRKILVRH